MKIIFKTLLFLYLTSFLFYACENENIDNVESLTINIPGWEIDSIDFIYDWLSINDLDFLNSRTGYILGTNGELLKTEDFAQTWSKSYIEIDSGGVNTSTQSFINETTGYIYGDYGSPNGDKYGTLYKTTDGGSTWTKRFYKPAYKLYSMHFYNDSTGIALNSINGVLNILTTSNSGESWEIATTDLSPTAYRLFFIGDICYVPGKDRKILKSSDKGKTWTIIDTPISSAEFIGGFYFLNENIGFLDSGGKKYKTTDGGNSWVQVNIPFGFRTPYSSYEYFHFCNNDDGIAIIDSIEFTNDGSFGGVRYAGSYVYTTSDGGNHWEKSDFFRDYYFGPVVFATNDLAYCISNNYVFILHKK